VKDSAFRDFFQCFRKSLPPRRPGPPTASPLLSGEIAWTVYGDGTVGCALDGQTAEGLNLPRLGVEFTVPGSMNSAAFAPQVMRAPSTKYGQSA